MGEVLGGSHSGHIWDLTLQVEGCFQPISDNSVACHFLNEENEIMAMANSQGTYSVSIPLNEVSRGGV